VGRGRPVVWERRSATLEDGRTIEWTWNPSPPHPQVIEARIDGAPVADRIEPDGTRLGHADVAAELLRSIGHPDGARHAPAW